MPNDPYLLSAPAILPMDPALPPLLLNAGLVITGDTITAIAPLSELRAKFGTLPTTHHNALLLPGLINAHTHLELSYLNAQSLSPPATTTAARFTTWVQNLIAAYPPPDQLEPTIRQAFTHGLTQSLQHGITTLGDISRQATITRDEYMSPQTPPARSSRFSVSPRLVSYAEIVGLGKMRHRTQEMLATAQSKIGNLKSKIPSDHPVTLSPCHLVTGLSPHAPYTVEGPALRAIVRQAIIHHLPLCMHLAELAEESQFLKDLSGPLGRDWDLMLKMDILDDQIPTYDGGPIRWAQLHGLLLSDPQNPPPRSLPVLLAHVNYCDHAELMQLARSRASVAYCPRTHAYFNHPPHPYRDMLAAGINVCLATDSLASNPDLNVLKEAALLHNRDQLDPLQALHMITINAAKALGLDHHVGSLAPHKQADLLLFPLDPTTPLTDASLPQLCHQLLTQTPTPTALYLAGQKLP